MNDLSISTHLTIAFPYAKFPHDVAGEILAGSMHYMERAVCGLGMATEDEDALLSLLRDAGATITDVRYSDSYVYVNVDTRWVIELDGDEEDDD